MTSALLRRYFADFEAGRTEWQRALASGTKLYDWKPATRGTSNTNDRGSASDRRARKQWLLDVFGDGHHAACRYCWRTLAFETITVDRIVPGCKGGRYVHGNIQPACGPCNSKHGGGLRSCRIDP